MTKELSSELEREGQLVFANMPEGLLLRLRWFTEALDIPVWQVLHNLLISQWAMSAAPSFAAKAFAPRPLLEFQRRDGVLLTGEVLFDNLVEQYASDLKREEVLHRWEGQTEAKK